jgi:hypothetical protein
MLSSVLLALGLRPGASVIFITSSSIDYRRRKSPFDAWQVSIEDGFAFRDLINSTLR